MDQVTPDRPERAGHREFFETDVREHGGTRLLVATGAKRDAITDHLDAAHQAARAHLHDHGAILFRGLVRGGAGQFDDFAGSFGHERLSYDFGSTPRSKVERGVYSSTEYPAHQWIPQHNEQSYTSRWPMKIWFYCDVVPSTGGDTPIADSRTLYRRLDPAVRLRFAAKQLMYVRNYGNGLDLPWERVFHTSDREQVEAFCAAHRIECEWRADGALRTRQVCQSEARHPVTGEIVWFNQAHLFHVSALETDIREALLSVVDEPDLPRNVFYGDGSSIEASILDEIRGCYRDVMLRFSWQEGDILMLDNMLMSHGRAPYEGARRILVAMAEAASLT